MMGWYGFRPYVPVARRRSQALKQMEKLKKKGMDIRPVCIEGRKIARTFWGEAWCDHLESFSDYENRLPRGRTYVRNGSVCHLGIGPGKITAMVSGSDIYTVDIEIKPLNQTKWERVKKSCAGQIGSILELLSGRLSKNVMEVVSHRETGLFPLPGEIQFACSCPDWAVMCKHVSAVLYGVGARLDESPELLFLLRGVDHEELITADVAVAVTGTKTGRRRIAEDALSDVFGIEMTASEPEAKQRTGSKREKPGKELKQPAKKTLIAKASKRKTETKADPVKVSKKSSSPKGKRRILAEPKPWTGKAIAGLRRKFGMSPAEFAGLLGVSAASVANWEKTPGVLSLRAGSLAALEAARKRIKAKVARKAKTK
jgi:uncharacterized Zn finger protein